MFAGFRDWVPKELQRVGCVELLNTVQKRVRPKLHAFGGIHEGTVGFKTWITYREVGFGVKKSRKCFFSSLEKKIQTAVKETNNDWSVFVLNILYRFLRYS